MAIRVQGFRSVFALLVLSSLLDAQDVEYAESFEPNRQYSAQWCVDGEMLRMRLSAAGTGWLAIGFSNNQSMPDTDVVMVTGEGAAIDAFADQRAAPMPDDQQDITIHSATQEGNLTVVEFSRPIVTGDDEGDYSLDADRFLLWAYNRNSDSFTSRHTARGFSSQRMNFQSAGACQFVGGFDNDFTGDGQLTVADIDALLDQIGSGNDSRFDVNADGTINTNDIADYLETAFNSYIGDSNLDGEFSSSDFVTVFTAGEYEDNVPMNSTWADGDWNGDSEFSTTDLVFAFQEGGFEKGSRPQAVPEPASLIWLGLAASILTQRRNR